MISAVLNKDIAKVLSLFALSKGSRFNRNEVLKRTKLNNLPLDNALVKLVNSKILVRGRNYYSLNFMEEYAKALVDMLSKQYKSLKEIPLDAYFTVIDLVDVFSAHKGVELYLFGSYSKLIFKKDSDIDIAVLSKKRFRIDTSKIEKRYGKNIEIHHFSKDLFYKNKKDPLVKDIIKNGVKLI